MKAYHFKQVMSIWIAIILLGSCSWLPFQGEGSKQESSKEPKMGPYVKQGRHTVHLVGAIVRDDKKFMEALDGGVSSLQEGHEVVVLFDGNSVPALRMHLKREKKTLLHDSGITGQERQALAERLKVSLTDAPSNYFEYVQYLAKAGARVFANRNGVKQFGLAEEEIHPIATLVTTGQISDILDQSDFCYTVGAVARH